MDATTDTEREIAAETARRAMLAGWDKAIRDVASEKGINPLAIEGILNKAAKENPNRDPSVRIDELNDWETQKMRNSSLKRNSLDRLSPGLRAYMLKKQLNN
jgi:hypothetical protein